MTEWPLEVRTGIEGIVLRAPDPIDAEPLTEVVNASLDHLGVYLGWARVPTTVGFQAVGLAVAAEALAAGGDAAYLLFEGDDVIGTVGLHRRAGPYAIEVGFWVRASHEGRGIVTAAVRALVDIVFAVDHGTERVVILCHPGNDRSAAVAQRAGFRLVEVDERPRMVWERRRVPSTIP